MNIFIIDDEISVRSILIRVLKKEGHESIPATSGQEAMQGFKAGYFDLAFIDINLGSQPDGITLAKKFRDLDPNLKIILMSGDPSNQSIVQKEQLGIFLRKPFDISQIRSLIAPPK